MTDTSIVTPLRPDAIDPLAAARKAVQRTRPKKKSANEIKAKKDKPSADAIIPATAVSVSPRHAPWSVWPLAGTTVGLMAVSLTHLSDGVTQLTAIPVWQAWAMAIGIDCMLISIALAQLTAPADVKKDIAVVAHALEAGTLVMSAGLNALAFTGGAFDAAHWAQIAFAASCRRRSAVQRTFWLD